MTSDDNPGVGVEMKSLQYMEQAAGQGGASIEDQAEKVYQALLKAQSLEMGVLFGGLVAGGIALTWPILDPTHLGWLALLMGPAVGFTVRMKGLGFSPIFGGIGAGLTLAGCVLGNVLTILYQEYFPPENYMPEEEGISIIGYIAYSPWMLIFYLAAVAIAFTLSFKQISKLSIMNQVRLSQGRMPK